MKSLNELSEKYDLEIDKILNEIKTSKSKLVLLQFPDGLKPYATAIVDFLEEQTKGNVEFLIWLGSCFGACDTPILPIEIQKKIDLVVQFGHNEMRANY
ncbi:MAG: diphthamide synthesis protein [Nanoarchaeota archaeon]|nr:diphthamide synthesis protein [Nanoarchaeota archaeon]